MSTLASQGCTTSDDWDCDEANWVEWTADTTGRTFEFTVTGITPSDVTALEFDSFVIMDSPSNWSWKIYDNTGATWVTLSPGSISDGVYTAKVVSAPSTFARYFDASNKVKLKIAYSSTSSSTYFQVDKLRLNVTTGGGGDTTAPTTPGSPTTSGITQTSITLSWTASTDAVGVTGYKVFDGSTQAGTTTSTSYTFTGLTCNASHTLKVSAYDAAGNNSAQASATAVSTSACSGGSTTTFDVSAITGTVDGTMSTLASQGCTTSSGWNCASSKWVEWTADTTGRTFEFTATGITTSSVTALDFDSFVIADSPSNWSWKVYDNTAATWVTLTLGTISDGVYTAKVVSAASTFEEVADRQLCD